MNYAAFLETKRQKDKSVGFDIDADALNPKLYPFQQHIVKWAIKKGRAALFEDCGLGKTLQELSWATAFARRMNKPVLLATPLAVSHQVIREAEKFGFDGVVRNQTGEVDNKALVVVTNYERLHYFKPDDFCGMVSDESSILKNFDGARRADITEFMRVLPYRLLATATAAPNDYIELGTSSEALGEMGYVDMLTKFFTNRQMSIDQRNRTRHMESSDGWRIKGHAVRDFWLWVASWAIACRKPSDVGFDDDRFVLPKLTEREHYVKAERTRDGFLFDLPAANLNDEREAQRRTIKERCEYAASRVSHTGQSLVWCNLNDEGDLLAEMIKDGEQVSGSDDDKTKEARLVAFADGNLKTLITKPKIGAWGLNLQRCAHMTFFPTHSYEQYYQAIRRCWRFGQKREVVVDVIAVEGVRNVMDNLRRKADQANKMFENIIGHINESRRIDIVESFTNKEEIPAWL